MIDERGSSPLWAVPSPRQVVLGYIRKQAMKNKPVSSLLLRCLFQFLPSVSCLEVLPWHPSVIGNCKSNKPFPSHVSSCQSVSSQQQKRKPDISPPFQVRFLSDLILNSSSRPPKEASQPVESKASHFHFSVHLKHLDSVLTHLLTIKGK